MEKSKILKIEATCSHLLSGFCFILLKKQLFLLENERFQAK